MTSIKQIVLLTVLAGGASSIWVPGLRAHLPTFITGGTQASSSAQVDDLEIFAEDLGPGDGFGPGFENPDGGTTQTPEPTMAKGGGELLNSLRNFKAYRLDLKDTNPVAVPTVNHHSEDPMAQSLVSEWVKDHALRGVMISPAGSRAFFGTLSYREGQEPAPGLLIQQILPDGVLLEFNEESLWIPLPALGSGARSHSANPSNSSSSTHAVGTSDPDSEIE